MKLSRIFNIWCTLLIISPQKKKIDLYFNSTCGVLCWLYLLGKNLDLISSGKRMRSLFQFHIGCTLVIVSYGKKFRSLFQFNIWCTLLIISSGEKNLIFLPIQFLFLLVLYSRKLTWNIFIDWLLITNEYKTNTVGQWQTTLLVTTHASANQKVPGATTKVDKTW